MIDRYLLRYFLAVVDEGKFSKAAALMNVSQPTLSVGISKLERLLGRPLFLRTNRRVELTEAGARFAEHARKIEREFHFAEQAVHGAKTRRTFRLGILPSIPSLWMAQLVTRLTPAEKEERVEFIEGKERDLLEGLGSGRLDAALTILRKDGERFASELLLTENYSLALSKRHPLSAEKTIEAEALADNTMILRRHCEVLGETSRHFTMRGVRPFFALRTTNDDRTLALVQAGLGVTVMPDSFAAPGVVRPRMAGFDFTRDIGILHSRNIDHAEAHTDPTLTALRDVIQVAAAQMPQQNS